MTETPAAPTCTAAECSRPSCRPPEYEPLCTKHYIKAIDRAKAEAKARVQERVRAAIEALKGEK